MRRSSERRLHQSDAKRFIETSTFHWYQRFEIAPGVSTPGERDVQWIMRQAGVPDDLTGMHVLDVGTTNGGMAFEAERRGAERVVAIDVYPPDWFGFDALSGLLGSQVEYRKSSVYQLPSSPDDQFDIVLFLGVLYHLRHPLLALDSLRRITRGWVALETAVADESLASAGEDVTAQPLARFSRRGELNEDPSNWFSPTVVALNDWCYSAGFEPHLLGAWPNRNPSRCMLRLDLIAGEPEYSLISYETPLDARPIPLDR